MLFCEGQERFGGLFGDEEQVEAFRCEGLLVGAAGDILHARRSVDLTNQRFGALTGGVIT
ncbi:MAG TPA: hypothetical protein VFZ97_15710 [Acidimicrobiales bacterium]